MFTVMVNMEMIEDPYKSESKLLILLYSKHAIYHTDRQVLCCSGLAIYVSTAEE